jgi:hypothetical protein
MGVIQQCDIVVTIKIDYKKIIIKNNFCQKLVHSSL